MPAALCPALPALSAALCPALLALSLVHSAADSAGGAGSSFAKTLGDAAYVN